MMVEDGGPIKKGGILCEWEASTIPVLSEVGGTVKFDAIIPEVTMREEVDKATGITNRVILEGKGDLHPQIILGRR